MLQCHACLAAQTGEAEHEPRSHAVRPCSLQSMQSRAEAPLGQAQAGTSHDAHLEAPVCCFGACSAAAGGVSSTYGSFASLLKACILGKGGVKAPRTPFREMVPCKVDMGQWSRVIGLPSLCALAFCTTGYLYKFMNKSRGEPSENDRLLAKCARSFLPRLGGRSPLCTRAGAHEGMRHEAR